MTEQTGLQKKVNGLGVMLKNSMTSIETLLPQGMDSARLCRLAINACIKNPALADCKPATFLMAVMSCAETGLEPTLGQCALVPYKGVVTFQPMYQGLIKLAMNTGKLSNIYAEVVREGDEFIYELGLEPKLVHRPKDNNTGKLIKVYAVAKLKDGSTQFVVQSQADVDKRRKVSKAKADGTPWGEWEEEMWKKTALKAVCKLLPKSAELAQALVNADRGEIGKPAIPTMNLADIGIDISEVADEPEGDGVIDPPKSKSKAPAPRKEGEPTDKEMEDLGWKKKPASDELPM